MSQITAALDYLKQGLSLAKSPGLRAYVIIPMIFNVLVFGGLALWFAMCVWFFVRTIRSVANAASQKAMPNPKTWLF